VRVGIFSTAHLHIDAYIGNLRAVAGVEVVGVADHDHARAGAWGDAHGVAVFDSYASLLDAGVDAVVVCSETSRHRELVEMAAGAGAHVLCEKPLAATTGDADAIVTACDRADVTLMTAFPMRFSPPVVQVRDMVRTGALGTVRACNGANQGQLPKRHRAWFVDPTLAGGGAVMDHTVHLADLLRWYLDAEVVEVYAVTNRLLHADKVDVETGGLVMLTFSDGTFASIDCSWSRPDAYPTWGGLRFELIGEGGVIAVDAFRQRLDVYSEAGAPVRWPAWGSDANQAMIDEFCAAVRGGRPPAVTGVDGQRATEIVVAAYASARTGQAVRLTPGSSDSPERRSSTP
jgi:predicted dehydrogenase